VISALLLLNAIAPSQRDRSLRERLALLAQSEPGLLIDGIPHRWLLRRTWRCSNDHVSTQLVSAGRRRPRCAFCGRNLYPTFPEDRNGRLPIHTAAEYRLIVEANMNRPTRPMTHRRASRPVNGQAGSRTVQLGFADGGTVGRARHALAENRRLTRRSDQPPPTPHAIVRKAAAAASVVIRTR